MLPNTRDTAERLYAIEVDLTGSNCGGAWHSTRNLLAVRDGDPVTPDQLQTMAAEHYSVPLTQVSSPRLTNQEAFDAEDASDAV